MTFQFVCIQHTVINIRDKLRQCAQGFNILNEKFPTENEIDGIKFIAVTCGKTTNIY